MPHLLRIDASSRLTGSTSRDLGDAFAQAWMARGPAYTVQERDVIAQPIRHISQTTIAGYYTPGDQMTAELREATALSDALIAELQQADELLITLPMYNFSVPSALKAWIDQIVRIGHTFAFDGQNFNGLVKAQKATIITAYGAGGYLNGGPFAGADFCGPYLKFLLGFLGVKSIEQIAVEATTGDAAALAAEVALAKGRIRRAVAA